MVGISLLRGLSIPRQGLGKILLRAASDRRAAVVRYGGDEFLVLLPASQPAEVQRIKDSIEQELCQYNNSGEAPLPVSFSAGISELRQPDLFQFFQDMDRAMYREKKAFYLSVSGGMGPGGGTQ